MIASCKKDPEMPGGELVNIKTNEITEITGFSAIVSSYVGAGCDERGVCWSESANPTVSNSHTTNGSGIGCFTSNITGLTDNTKYYVRAYATDSKGTSYGEQKSFITMGAIAGHEYVDLGLPSGLLWATCNVGADKPEDYGDYFAWGETETKSDYNWSTYKWCNGSSHTLTKYDYDNKMVLDPEDDAAYVNWGGGWRMPTSAEFRELYNNTTNTLTTENGVYGMKFVSKTDNSKYVFLPAAGYCDDGNLHVADSYAHYWLSVRYWNDPICAEYFGSSSVVLSFDYRYRGRSVRPVCPSQK